MASEAQKAISDEMFDLMVLEVYEYVKDGRLSKLKVKQAAREICDKRDENGERIFYDIRYTNEKRAIVEDTFYQRIKDIVVNWRKYVAPQMELLLIEATYQQALKAKDNPTAFKTAASVIMPQVSDNDGTKPALSSRTIAILQREPVETNIHIGQGNVAEGLGDKGHEGADRVHPVADGQRQDITFEGLPSGHDTVVYGVHEGGDSAQGSAVPDTEVPPQDPVDNDSGNGMGALE